MGQPLDEVALPRAWQARWVWYGDTGVRAITSVQSVRDPEVLDRWVLLRRSFVLDAEPLGAMLRAAGDSRFVISVNGHEVCRGPVRSDPRQQRSELVDVGPILREGLNVIAVQARYYGAPTSWWLPAPTTLELGGGSFLAELFLDGHSALGTDQQWRALPGDAWQVGEAPTGTHGYFVENVDARRLPAGWCEAGYDDTDWPYATVLSACTVGGQGEPWPPSDPYGPLMPRPVPALEGALRRPRAARRTGLVDATDAAPGVPQVLADQARAAEWEPFDHDLVGPGDALVLFDFGEIVAGTVRLRAEAEPGTRFDLAFAEALDADGSLAAATAHSGGRYVARGERDDHELMDPMGGRHLAVSVRSTGPVRLEVGVQERLFPQPAGVASFSCSDPVLDEVFAVGLRTVALCAHDAYVDCPTREQRAWTGDAVVHQSVHLATHPDWSLARWHPQLTDTPRTDGMLPMDAVSNLGGAPDSVVHIPDWALHWVRSVHNLMRYTGDRDLVASLLPTAERVLRWFLPYQGDDGLVSRVPGWVLIDWSNVQVAGTSAALNALWARGLKDVGEMASWLGDAGRARWAEGVWAQVREGFEVFWHEGRGAYRDHRVDGEIRPAVSRHTNAAAVVGGLVPTDRLAQLVDLLTDRTRLAHSVPHLEAMAAGDRSLALRRLVEGNPPPSWDMQTQVLEAQPFFRYVVHDALAEAGRADLVADACRDWKVFLDAGETTWPETWAGGTHCHAWSSTPTRDLIVHTLGIAPAEPGFGRARVAPRLGDLEWARAMVPLPQGELCVDATDRRVELTSPVPVQFDTGTRVVDLPPGHHALDVDTP